MKKSRKHLIEPECGYVWWQAGKHSHVNIDLPYLGLHRILVERKLNLQWNFAISRIQSVVSRFIDKQSYDCVPIWIKHYWARTEDVALLSQLRVYIFQILTILNGSHVQGEQLRLSKRSKFIFIWSFLLMSLNGFTENKFQDSDILFTCMVLILRAFDIHYKLLSHMGLSYTHLRCKSKNMLPVER